MWKAFQTHACNNPPHQQNMNTCAHMVKDGGREKEEKMRKRVKKEGKKFK